MNATSAQRSATEKSISSKPRRRELGGYRAGSRSSSRICSSVNCIRDSSSRAVTACTLRQYHCRRDLARIVVRQSTTSTSASRPWCGIKRAATARVATSWTHGPARTSHCSKTCSAHAKFVAPRPFIAGAKFASRVRNLGVTRPTASALWHPPTWLSLTRSRSSFH